MSTTRFDAVVWGLTPEDITSHERSTDSGFGQFLLGLGRDITLRFPDYNATPDGIRAEAEALRKLAQAALEIAEQLDRLAGEREAGTGGEQR